MARKRKYKDRELIESKKFIAQVYTASESYDPQRVINGLKFYWPEGTEWFYIIHDSDSWTEDDVIDYQIKQKEEPPFVAGEVKKEHIHIVINLPYPITLGNAANKLGIPSQYVQDCLSVKSSVQYLIHLNNPNKFQYTLDKIVTNVDNKRLEKLMKKEVEAQEKAVLLLDYIELGCTSITDLAQYAIKSGCWDELRRGQHIYTALIYERNQKNESKSYWNPTY